MRSSAPFPGYFGQTGCRSRKYAAFDPRGFLLVSDFGDCRFDQAYAAW